MPHTQQPGIVRRAVRKVISPIKTYMADGMSVLEALILILVLCAFILLNMHGIEQNDYTYLLAFIAIVVATPVLVFSLVIQFTRWHQWLDNNPDHPSKLLAWWRGSMFTAISGSGRLSLFGTVLLLLFVTLVAAIASLTVMGQYTVGALITAALVAKFIYYRKCYKNSAERLSGRSS